MSKVNSAITLSDLHLGSENNYFHYNSPEFENNKTAVISLFKRLGKQDEIIINGDFLELSLVGLDEVYKDAREFFAILAECGLFEKIVYIPGNHDHHFWRELVEQVYINGQLKKGDSPPGCEEFPHCFVDNRFSTKDTNRDCNIVLTSLWPEKKPMPEIVVKYPHHLLRVPTGGNKEQYYLITHGHFLEDLFKPINYLIDPARLDELEGFNNIWLEAFDYHLGQSGRLADSVRKIVVSYEEGGKEAKKTVKKILNGIRKNLTRKLKLNWLKSWLLKIGFKILFKKIPLEKKTGLYKAPLNDDLRRNTKEYINKYLLKRYQEGNKQKFHIPVDKAIPSPFTFVFGHTHLPTINLQDNEDFIEIEGERYPLVNTGGWLRNDGTKPNGENAGVLLINQQGVTWESLAGQLR